jgi:uncharacterized protein (DUF2236 family)
VTETSREAPDPGLFGPDSVTWKVAGDPVMALAGITALLLQAVHPGALHGVLSNSSFRQDPWGRLARTADYVGTVSFGSTDEATAAGARVRGIHQRIGVDDPHLLQWVHVCEAWSFVTVTRRCGLALTDAEVDRFWSEQRRAARLVGVRDAPASMAEAEDYFRDRRPELTVTRETRSILRFVGAPPMPGWVRLATPARPLWAGLAATAFGLMPGWARRMYVPLGPPASAWAAAAAGRALRTSLMAVPESRRTGPHRRAALERLALVR